MTNSKKDSEDCYCNCHSPNSSAVNCKHCVINPVLTYPSKDSELLEIINNVYQMGKWDEANSKGAYYGGGRSEAIQAINSKYITKEESDRRVLEGRIEEQSRALQYMQGWKYKDDYKRKIAELSQSVEPTLSPPPNFKGGKEATSIKGSGISLTDAYKLSQAGGEKE